MTVKLKESVVENLLVCRVKEAGGRCEKVTVLGARGFFDRLIVLPGGRVIFCEVKRPQGGRLSPHQIMRHQAYQTLGAEVRVVRNEIDIDRLMSGA